MREQRKKQSTCFLWTSCVTVKVNLLSVFMLVDTTHCSADGEITDVSLSSILMFFTGAEYPPPTGFQNRAEMWFDSESVFPTPSTYALVLTLPTKYYDNSEMFIEKMIYALNNHGGFGML